MSPAPWSRLRFLQTGKVTNFIYSKRLTTPFEAPEVEQILPFL
jgi:hypothetical protein